jgi:hypothetical protein
LSDSRGQKTRSDPIPSHSLAVERQQRSKDKI